MTSLRGQRLLPFYDPPKPSGEPGPECEACGSPTLDHARCRAPLQEAHMQQVRKLGMAT